MDFRNYDDCENEVEELYKQIEELLEENGKMIEHSQQAPMLHTTNNTVNNITNNTINTVYFGGGTPSVLEFSDIHKILKSIYKREGLSPLNCLDFHKVKISKIKSFNTPPDITEALEIP